MDDLVIATVGLLVLSVPIGLIILTVSHLRLRRKVAVMRSQLDLLWREQTARDAEGAEDAPKPSPVTSSETRTAPRPERAANVVALKEPAADSSVTPTDDKTDQTASPPKQRTVWKRPDAPQPTAPASQAVVFNAERFAALSVWMQQNWFYLAAAMSLALAGIFFVQYGIETGLLSPAARVASSLAFGAGLILCGEWIRRRFGDGENSTTAYLPSVLSGAGLVSLMGGILAARMLYNLIDPTTAFAGLFAVAIFAMILGWFHGALLAAVGLIGGIAAPFLVGGSSDTPEILLLYFALMVALGLAIDTVRRWAWISVLSLVLGQGAATLLWVSDMSSGIMNAGFAAFAAGLTLLTVLIPARGLWPDHAGNPMLAVVWARLKRQDPLDWPIFPARLSLGVTLSTAVVLYLTAEHDTTTFWVSLSLASALTVLFTLWSRAAPALQDHALIPAAVIVALLAAWDTSWDQISLMRDILASQEGQTEVRMLWHITFALLAAVVPTLFAAWRSLNTNVYAPIWAAGAVLLAPLAGLALEMTWNPVSLIGAWPWAFHALALSGLMTAFALRYDRADPNEKLRVSLAMISALACLAFALGVVLTQAALTLALAATVLAAAALDRRFDLPLLGGYIVAGIVALGARLVIDPGLDWATRAPFWDMLLAYGGVLLALLGALYLQSPMSRPKAQVFLESAVWSVGGMTLSLCFYHAIEHFAGHDFQGLHWQMGLYGTIWIGLAATQIYRMKLGGSLLWLRVVLTVVYGICALTAVGVTVSAANPLLVGQTIVGVAVGNTLIAAYLMPALALAIASLTVAERFYWARFVLRLASITLAVFWVILTIRHGWRGSSEMPLNMGVSEPELYSYTVALLLSGATLFYQALARNSDLLRRAGVLVIAIAVAKVFFIDISGLQGLVRVFSFLFLGLSLAGLAWLNRWVDMRAGNVPPSADTPTDTLD